MVDSYASSIEAQRYFLKSNLETFIHTNSGEYALIEGGVANIKVTFYKSKEELKKAMEEYNKEDITVHLIPKTMAGFKGKTYAEKTIEFLKQIEESQIIARRSRIRCGGIEAYL